MTVLYDNSNSAEGNDTNPTVTLTVAANSIVLVGLFVNNDPAVSAATFDGNAMTLVHQHTGAAGFRLYRYHGHAAGSRTASFTVASANSWGIGVISLTGFDTSTPVGTPQEGASSETTSVTTASIASATGEMIVDLAVMINIEMSPQAAQTQRIYRASLDGGFLSFGMSTKPGAASTTMQWESPFTVGDNRIIGVSVKAAAAASATLTAESGSYGLSGQTAGLFAGGLLTAEQGSYSLIGSDALRDITSVAEQGSYTLTGQAANLIDIHTVTALSGSYSFLGQAASLIYSSAASIDKILRRGRLYGFRLNR